MKNNIVATGLSRLWAGVLTPANGLRDAGIDVTLLYRQQVVEFTPKNIGVRAIRVRSNLLLQTLVFCWQLISRKPAHVEFYFHSGRWLALRVQARLCTMFRVPIVCVCTGSELREFDKHGEAKRNCIRSVFAKAQAVILKELYMRDVIRELALIDESRTFLVSNRVRVTTEYSTERKEPIALFLNLFNRYRHIELIVEAVPLVLAVLPTLKFRIVGTGRYPEYEKELREQAAHLGVLDKLEFLPFTQDAPKYFAEASVFLLPADVVFCNNALLEAMERGVPAIVADVEGAERIIQNEINGLRVERSAVAIADAIIRLCADETLRRQMGEGARQTIVDRFDERQRTSELINLYKDSVWGSTETD